MSERKWSVLSLAASLALAGLTVVFSQSLPYAAVLLGIAIVLVLGTASWSVWEWLPRALTDLERPKVVARSIYRKAASKGGTIHATHIYPKEVSPEQDFAVEELASLGSNVEVSFYRVLMLDSIEDERRWLTLLFGQLHKNVTKHFYTLSSYPLLLPRIAKALLPRLNLLLYRSPGGRSCQVFVGLDRLHLTGGSVNFALHSRSKRVYGALLRYFELLTGSRHFASCTSLEEYDATQRASSQVQRGQAVVSRIVDCAETTKGIVFIGMFGSIARAALGLTGEIAADASDADVDLLIVFDPRTYPGTEEDLRAHVESALDVRRTRVTWGPDLSVFYPFRDEQRIDVDVECLPVGDNFYSDNRLLGHSVFRHFMLLYSVEQRAVVSYIQVPMTPLTARERWHLVVSDRQGLTYFRDRIDQPSASSDPRRLCSHVLRNAVWAITGSWPTTGRAAGQFLAELPDWKDEDALREAISLLSFSTQQIRSNLQPAFDKVRAVIDFILKHARVETGAS